MCVCVCVDLSVFERLRYEFYSRFYYYHHHHSLSFFFFNKFLGLEKFKFFPFLIDDDQPQPKETWVFIGCFFAVPYEMVYPFELCWQKKNTNIKKLGEFMENKLQKQRNRKLKIPLQKGFRKLKWELFIVFHCFGLGSSHQSFIMTLQIGFSNENVEKLRLAQGAEKEISSFFKIESRWTEQRYIRKPPCNKNLKR